MEKTVVNEVSATIAALRSAGETGFLIILFILIALIGLGVVAIVYQRFVISKFENSSKATQDYIKAIETSIKERELGVKERDELRNVFSQQFSLVTSANNELRLEIKRLSDQQNQMEHNINHTIDIGLENIRNRLENLTLNEILSGLPENFRKNITREIDNATAHAIENIRSIVLDNNVYSDISKTILREISRNSPETIKNMIFLDRTFVNLLHKELTEALHYETNDSYSSARLSEYEAKIISSRVLSRIYDRTITWRNENNYS